MTIITDKGIKIEATAKPEWNQYHQRFYVWGRRWIASKGKFSTVTGLLNFTGYTDEAGDKWVGA